MADAAKPNLRGIIKHNPKLDPYEGQWVLVRDSDGEVVAHAPTSMALVTMIKIEDRTGCVMQYVHPPSDSWQVW